MNYLAHIFLSGDDKELMLGNFIADSVKGRQALAYAPEIARGIELHRQIDTFTDTHAVVQESKNRLRPQFRKFAGVIADVFYDHFLASKFGRFSNTPLPDYAQRSYRFFIKRFDDLPERVQHFLPHMIRHDWLSSYARLSGIRQSLTGLSRRTRFESGMERATEELEKNYKLYEKEFDIFFPELQQFVARQLEQVKV